ncbi:MAG: hypothetical protein WA051_01825 [Minisyncoccia bacterium]
MAMKTKGKESVEAQKLLAYLNSEYLKIHTKFEKHYWTSYMGDHSVDTVKDKALKAKDDFQSNSKLRARVVEAVSNTDNVEQKQKLNQWLRFFDCYQTPKGLEKLKEKINALETKMHKKMADGKEGYIDPKTKKFVKASMSRMSGIVRTSNDENLRKACYQGVQKRAYLNIKEYIQYVKMLNTYAKKLGFSDFYEYKIFVEEGMTKKELFNIFDGIYKKTKYAFADIRKLEKSKPNLRKPWNFSYMLAGDFAKEDDRYFPFEKAMERWGKSFASMGIDFRGSTLNLDLLNREGKYNNGFCHWPIPINYKNGKRMTGQSNFTCNVVYGQVGSAVQGYATLFHEGGHAAHYLNSEQTEVCMNTEYPPASTAWAETQSMFLDTVFSSIEWKSRYAKNKDGVGYPLELFERKVKRLHILRPLDLMGIIAVCNFEKAIYEEKNLTPKKVLEITKKMSNRYFDYSEPSLWLLNVNHIYSWASTCSYHGYGLATLALNQWRDYFFKKYGHIVDNRNIGKEMKEVWKLASSKTFKEFVILATGNSLSADAWLKNVTKSIPEVLKDAKQRIKRLEKVPEHKGKIDLNAKINMVSGKKIVANNARSFEEMGKKYENWLMR